MFAREDIPSFAPNAVFSPDGRALAYVKLRPTNTSHHLKWILSFFQSGDIWVQLAPGLPAINITNGAADDSSWGKPVWSPDGQRLAMLSTRDDNIRIWIWERADNTLRPLNAHSVERYLYDGLWVDSSRILYVTGSGDRPTENNLPLRNRRIALEGWSRFDRGEVTADALSSAVEDGASRPGQQLVLTDVNTGESRILSARPSFVLPFVQASPNRRAVAFYRFLASIPPTSDLPPPSPFGDCCNWSLDVVGLDGQVIFRTADQQRRVPAGSAAWSHDGNELDFWEFDKQDAKVLVLRRLDLVTGMFSNVELGDLQVSADDTRIDVAAEGEILIRAARRADANRRDWWSVDRRNRRRCLTCAIPAAPDDLVPVAGKRSFVGLADGSLWQIDLKKRALDRLAPATRLMGLSPSTFRDQGYTRVLIASHSNEMDEEKYAVVETKTGVVKPLVKPDPAARLVAYAPSANEESAVYYSNTHSGTWLQRLTGTKQRDLLFEANRFMRDVAEAHYQAIEYNSLNGEQLKGWVLLPADRVPGKRYPLLAYVYPGQSQQDPQSSAINTSASSLNMQIPAAQGYAVLLPSMPATSQGSASDPLLGLTDGVLPAIERAVELGIADGQRVFLLGHSFGGYAVNGLIGQTQRFKAAVSSAGISDPISKYGQQNRYSDFVDGSEFWYAEIGQGGMGSAPWKDLGRYLRNSPLTYVDRVQTPLLLVHGDLDEAVNMQQAEEMFQALYRQGKPAQLVRYWGESHLLESPANIRDLWTRIFAWFDDFGDIQRDAQGNLIWEGEHVKSREGAKALRPDDFLKFARFFVPDTAKGNAKGN